MRKVSALFVLLCFFVHVTEAKVKLPSVFSDNMVLQQKTNVAIWGEALRGKRVTVTTTWDQKKYKTVADDAGHWKVKLTTPAYGGPYSITITDGEAMTLKNVLIGEVWICSGQSNMEMPLAGWGKINNYEKEIATAGYPGIRLLQAAHVTSNTPLEDAQVTNGGWRPCSPQTVAEFSSAAYFFAREIYTRTKIPIGLIQVSWGGTVAEAWTSGTTLRNMADFKDAVTKAGNTIDLSPAELTQKIQSWQDNIDRKDVGYQQGGAPWAEAAFNDAAWQKMALPSYWEEEGLPDFDGVVWFRKKITIPRSWEGKDVRVELGKIDDNDITWFNGKKIGATIGYDRPRNYIIPGTEVHAGESTLAVRVFDWGGGGGIYGEPGKLALTSVTGERISLTGNWFYKPGVAVKGMQPSPVLITGPNRPSVLYNAMIHPYIQFAIRGVIWYQGEANTDRAWQYHSLFPAMIADWRKEWGIGDFPFYFVQLANFMKANPQPVASTWAELREAQLKTLFLPNTGMAVTIDIGNPGNIHPKNKQEVGRRLALIALAKTYGQKIAYTGPVFESQHVERAAIRLNFTPAGGSLTTGNNPAGDNNKPLRGFAIAGADHIFHWADACTEGNQIVVSSPEVPAPVAVRYAWANNPEGANLYNTQGLPASPFRTDDWPVSTVPPPDASRGKHL